MITFHPEKHEYFNDKNEKYISVSGLAHLLEEACRLDRKSKE
jgi:hypothetical protein